MQSELHGLLGAQQYNGKPCTLIEFDAVRKRWAVKLDDGTILSVKPENITVKKMRPCANCSKEDVARTHILCKGCNGTFYCDERCPSFPHAQGVLQLPFRLPLFLVRGLIVAIHVRCQADHSTRHKTVCGNLQYFANCYVCKSMANLAACQRCDKVFTCSAECSMLHTTSKDCTVPVSRILLLAVDASRDKHNKLIVRCDNGRVVDATPDGIIRCLIEANIIQPFVNKVVVCSLTVGMTGESYSMRICTPVVVQACMDGVTRTGASLVNISRNTNTFDPFMSLPLIVGRSMLHLKMTMPMAMELDGNRETRV
jgi:hypothetical protein